MNEKSSKPRRRWSITLREAFLLMTICGLIAGWYVEYRARAQIEHRVGSILEAIEKAKSTDDPDDGWGGAIVFNDFICEWDVRPRQKSATKHSDAPPTFSDTKGEP